MTKLVIRHEISHANIQGNPAFGSHEASLTEIGAQRAVVLGETLNVVHGIDVATTPIAVSMLRRSQETAIYAGFRKLSLYPLLNEVDHGMSKAELAAALRHHETPYHMIKAAEETLRNPPDEDVWITHAYRIRAMCDVLGVHQDSRFLLRFGEVITLPI